MGLLENAMFWYGSRRACCWVSWRKNGCLDRWCVKSKLDLKLVEEQDSQSGAHSNTYREVHLPGWINWQLGKVGAQDGNYYDVSFYDDEFLYDIV